MNIENETLLRELATKLGTTAEHLWGVLIKQAYISSLTAVVLIGVWLVILAVSGWLLLRAVRENVEFEALILPFIVWSALTLVTVIAIATSASNILAGFYNPEYWALQKVLSMLKGN